MVRPAELSGDSGKSPGLLRERRGPPAAPLALAGIRAVGVIE